MSILHVDDAYVMSPAASWLSCPRHQQLQDDQLQGIILFQSNDMLQVFCTSLGQSLTRRPEGTISVCV